MTNQRVGLVKLFMNLLSSAGGDKMSENKIFRCSTRAALSLLVPFSLVAASGFAQTNLPVKWEELTAGDFVTAILQAQGTCLLPFGILEKHGPHLPIERGSL